MIDGYIMISTEGRIIEVNPAYCKMLGYTREEILQKYAYELEGKLTKEEVTGAFKEIADKKQVQLESRHIRKNKTLIDVEISAFALLFEDKLFIAGFIKDITERKKIEEQVKAYNTQLKQLTAHLQSIREEERRRIGREIHDDLGQQLTAIKMDIAWIDKNTAAASKQIKTKLKNIIQLLDGSNLSVRRILSELKPSILDEYGLLDAMDWQRKQFTANTGIPVELVCTEKEIKLPADIATCIFRIFQESLTNITRYAKAKNVITSISLSGNHISVSIKDDGKGFDTSKIRDMATFGILGMQERVSALAGKFNIQSENGKGTMISVKIPYKI
jgi:PAS domain S-box-containing protein